ncbi:MAG: hypothetical protein HY718_19715 [Planctomycetes bacterium]|nr:hypothetical protein [Planctomycetota bacterium]
MSFRRRNARAGIGSVLLVACGLFLGALPACDTDVQTTLVTGLNDAAISAASALINAAFETITPDEDSAPVQGDGNSGGNTVPQI